MNTASLSFAGITALLVAIAVVISFRLQAERNDVARLQARVIQLERSATTPDTTPDTESTSIEATAPASPTQEAPHEAQSVKTTSVPSGQAEHPPEKSNDQSYAEIMHRRLSNPTYMAAMVARSRQQIEDEFPGLARALQLAPDVADRFLNLLAQQKVIEWDRQQLLEEAGQPQDEAALAERRRSDEEFRKQVAADRLALIGATGMQRWNDYWGSLPARQEVQALRAQLVDSSAPLREEQIQPLVESLGALQRSHTEERENNYSSMTGILHPSYDQNLAYMQRRLSMIERFIEAKRSAAAQYLDREQQSRYNETLDRDLQRARLELEHWRIYNKAEKPDALARARGFAVLFVAGSALLERWTSLESPWK